MTDDAAREPSLAPAPPAAAIPLPVVDPSRVAFGFARTSCACPDCTVSCRFIPGMLVPADLERLAPGGDDAAAFAWADAHLLASPGGVVRVRNPGGEPAHYFVRIPTLVPARAADGRACHWLDGDGRCQVHDDSPFGCAFLDSHMLHGEADERAMAAIKAVATDHNAAGLYHRVWKHLHLNGRRAPSPEESREVMRAALGLTAVPVADPAPSANEPVYQLACDGVTPDGAGSILTIRGERSSLAADASAYAKLLQKTEVEIGRYPFARPGSRGRPSGRQRTGQVPIRNTAQACGRNEPCPCGSGKKFKKCHAV